MIWAAEPHNGGDFAMVRRMAVMALSLLLIATTAIGQEPDTVSFNAGKGRSVSGKNRIVSQNRPTIVLDVTRELTSVGVINFPLKRKAQVERYLFVRADESGRAQRLFIAQFESLLPGIAGSYTIPATNPTRIGTHDYQTQVGFFNFAAMIAANPGAEAEQTRAYLNRLGVKVDDDFVVARYARVASEDKRSELILFYYENVRELGATRAELEDGGSRASERKRIFTEFAARALRSFEVVADKS
jgi:hypothetical protein